MFKQLAMKRVMSWFAVAGLACFLGLTAGCEHSDKPHDYGQARPSVDDLDYRDAGLQSRDVNDAANKVAASLLATPELNASQKQWVVVLDTMEDHTRDHMFMTDFDIFLQALKARVAEQGRGRVTLVLNRDKLYHLREKELDSNPAAPSRLQPDFALTGVVRDLPRQGTIYYLMDFKLANLHTGIEQWSKSFEVKVAR